MNAFCLRTLFAGTLLWLGLHSAQAVAIYDYTYTFSPTEGMQVSSVAYTYSYSSTLTSATVANWETGWGSTGITGINYVGRYSDSSAVYLGNGWILTAAHITKGATTFTLNGLPYDIASGEYAVGDSDLIMLQIANAPDLPALTLATSTPTLGSQVVMLGYGGTNPQLSWGANTVGAVNQEGIGTTVAFTTVPGDRKAELVVGDSGGAGFIFNGTSWVLAGINDGIGTNSIGETGSALADISVYAGLITANITTYSATPEPESYVLFALGGLLIFFAVRRRRCA